MNSFNCCVVLTFTLVFTSCNVNAMTYGELLTLIEEDEDPANTFVLDDDTAIDNNTIFVRDLDEEIDGAYLLYKLAGEHLEGMTASGLGGSPCKCRKYSCSCCASKKFSVKIVFKRFSKTLSVCVEVAYLPKNLGFKFTLRLNGKKVFGKEISLKHPPALCYKVPGLGSIARICAEIYNVDLRRKSLCVRASGVLNIKIKKFKVNLKIACFKIPIVDEDVVEWLEAAQNDPDYLEMNSLPLIGNNDVYRMIVNEFEP